MNNEISGYESNLHRYTARFETTETPEDLTFYVLGEKSVDAQSVGKVTKFIESLFKKFENDFDQRDLAGLQALKEVLTQIPPEFDATSVISKVDATIGQILIKEPPMHHLVAPEPQLGKPQEKRFIRDREIPGVRTQENVAQMDDKQIEKEFGQYYQLNGFTDDDADKLRAFFRYATEKQLNIFFAGFDKEYDKQLKSGQLMDWLTKVMGQEGRSLIQLLPQDLRSLDLTGCKRANSYFRDMIVQHCPHMQAQENIAQLGDEQIKEEFGKYYQLNGFTDDDMDKLRTFFKYATEKQLNAFFAGFDEEYGRQAKSGRLLGWLEKAFGYEGPLLIQLLPHDLASLDLTGCERANIYFRDMIVRHCPNVQIKG